MTGPEVLLNLGACASSKRSCCSLDRLFCLRLTAACVTNIERSTPRGLFCQSRKTNSSVVTVFERSLKELNALEKSPGPFSVLAWCKYRFFFTPSTTDTHNSCAGRGRARSVYHILKKFKAFLASSERVVRRS